MASFSFDPLAHIYDATRGYPAEVAREIAQSLEQAANATAETAFLDVGVGTGRIALPVAARGHTYTGVDISAQMLSLLRAKLLETGWQERDLPWGSFPDEQPNSNPPVKRFVQEDLRALLRLVHADITSLPFRDASFDVAIAVHIFHLVGDWQQAVRETVRVLRPDGVILSCSDQHESSELSKIAFRWDSIVRELGWTQNVRGNSISSDLERLLEQMGWQWETMTAATWTKTGTPRNVVDSYVQRLWSSTRRVPDDLALEAGRRLEQWAHEYFGASIDQEFPEVRHLIIRRAARK